MNPKFLLSKQILKQQVETLTNLGLKISYSYKTNREVGNLLQEISPETNFSIHAKEEIEMIKDKSKISFFTQAESTEELKQIIQEGITTFVVDNEIDLNNLLKTNAKINLSLRMKFQEHRIGTGKYFVYGMPSKKINEIISQIKDNPNINNLGIHIHRKSQNTSEWEIQEELEDSLTKESLTRINTVNLGGGLPTKYRSYTSKVMPYIFQKLTNAKNFLDKHNIQTIIEPGRFLAAPCIKLETEIVQIYDDKIIINTTIYNCALDNTLTNTKMLIRQELNENQEGKHYLIKGNSPTRDDIFRYKVKLQNPKVGDKITFLNAGAYNYTTDFFGYKKLETKIEQ
jgi:ornithine decarboxylase|tara:strand:- start:305 stop:1330 length:1026 start_codon:yes stop_codon:yes gene_type:complete